MNIAILTAGGVGSRTHQDINGIIVPINSDKAIAEGIVRLFKDKALKEKYEKNAKKTYNEKFSYPAFCKNYLTVYNSL